MAPEASVAQLIEEDQADAFLETLLGAAERGWPPGISRSAWGYSDNYAESLQHERSGWRSAPPEAHHWWQETLDSLRIAFADADRYALHWL